MGRWRWSSSSSKQSMSTVMAVSPRTSSCNSHTEFAADVEGVVQVMMIVCVRHHSLDNAIGCVHAGVFTGPPCRTPRRGSGVGWIRVGSRSRVLPRSVSWASDSQRVVGCFADYGALRVRCHRFSLSGRLRAYHGAAVRHALRSAAQPLFAATRTTTFLNQWVKFDPHPAAA